MEKKWAQFPFLTRLKLETIYTQFGWKKKTMLVVYFFAKALSHRLEFEITLAPVNDIVYYTHTDKAPKYQLTNLELEYYRCITSDYLAQEASMSCQVGKGFFHENIHLMDTFTINKKNDGIILKHTNIHRRSATGILCLFTDESYDGMRNSEKVLNPNITSVHQLYQLYSKGMIPTEF